MGRTETGRHLSLLFEGWGDPGKGNSLFSSRIGANPAAWLPGCHLLVHRPATSQRNPCFPSDALLPGFPLPRMPRSPPLFTFNDGNRPFASFTTSNKRQLADKLERELIQYFIIIFVLFYFIFLINIAWYVSLSYNTLSHWTFLCSCVKVLRLPSSNSSSFE